MHPQSSARDRGSPQLTSGRRVRDSVCERGTERDCAIDFLTVCHSRCSLSAEAISINAGKQGEEEGFRGAGGVGERGGRPQGVTAPFPFAVLLQRVVS